MSPSKINPDPGLGYELDRSPRACSSNYFSVLMAIFQMDLGPVIRYQNVSILDFIDVKDRWL